MHEAGNPWQREEDLLDDEISLFRRIYALRDQPDLKALVKSMVQHIEGEGANVTIGRINNLIKTAKKQEKRGGL